MEESKECTGCQRILPLASFNFALDKRRSRCQECDRAYTAKWRAANPEKLAKQAARTAALKKLRYTNSAEHRAAVKAANRKNRVLKTPEQKRAAGWKNHLITKYGIRPEDYDAMKEKQQGRCACCGRIPKKLVIDHCHDTGKVRGLLCQRCNSGIGQAGDTAESLKRALSYLEKPSFDSGITAGLLSMAA